MKKEKACHYWKLSLEEEHEFFLTKKRSLYFSQENSSKMFPSKCPLGLETSSAPEPSLLLGYL